MVFTEKISPNDFPPYFSRKSNGKKKTDIEEEGDVGTRRSGTKRKRGAVKTLRGVEGRVGALQSELDAIIESLPSAEVPASKSRRKTRATKPRAKKRRKGTLKSNLLKSLRADRKKLKAQLRDIERDINSLICKKKK